METVTKIITVQLLEAHHMEKKVNQNLPLRKLCHYLIKGNNVVSIYILSNFQLFWFGHHKVSFQAGLFK